MTECEHYFEYIKEIGGLNIYLCKNCGDVRKLEIIPPCTCTIKDIKGVYSAHSPECNSNRK